MLYKLLKG